jgi:hypothetical protein
MTPLRLLLCLVALAPTISLAQSGRVAGATIRGEVFDSIALRPMARAVVQLARVTGARVDGTWSAATDSSGRYAFDV